MTSDMRRYIKLMELNVVNLPDLENFVKSQAINIKNETMRKWFFASARKFLINSEKDNSQAKPSHTAPEWMVKTYHPENEDGQLHRFRGHMGTNFGHIIDWLNSIDDYAKMQDDGSNSKRNQMLRKIIAAAKKYSNGIMAVNLKEMIDTNAADKWFDMINNFTEITDESALIVVKAYDEGYKWVDIKSENGLKREGKLMSHCVGGYWKDVRGGKTQIYSLRDETNNPHATIEVTKQRLVQIKGKSNDAPVVKYIKYVLDFLNENLGNIVNFDCADLYTAGITRLETGVFISSGRNDREEKEDRPERNDDVVETVADFGNGYVLKRIQHERSTAYALEGCKPHPTWYVINGNIYNFSSSTTVVIPSIVGKKLVEYMNDSGWSIEKEDFQDLSKESFSMLGLGIVFKDGAWSYVADRELQSFAKGQIYYDSGFEWTSFYNHRTMWELRKNRYDITKLNFGIKKSNSKQYSASRNYYLDDLINIAKKVKKYLPWFDVTVNLR